MIGLVSPGNISFCENIGMEFGIQKCAMEKIEKGKLVK